MLNAQRKRFYMAITLMNTVCYSLSRERLYDILDNFPEVCLPAISCLRLVGNNASSFTQPIMSTCVRSVAA